MEARRRFDFVGDAVCRSSEWCRILFSRPPVWTVNCCNEAEALIATEFQSSLQSVRSDPLASAPHTLVQGFRWKTIRALRGRKVREYPRGDDPSPRTSLPHV
jgi:hypothetical protein